MTLGSLPAVDLDSEGGRSFFQERLAFLGRFGFLCSSGFYLLSVLLPLEFLPGWSFETQLAFLATQAVMAVTWVLCGSVRLPTVALHTVDALAVTLTCLVWALPPLYADPSRGLDFLVLLGATDFLLLRAVFVPSAPLHTLALGLLSQAPAMAVAHVVYGSLPAIWVTVFCLGAVAVATLTSQVIYGLRQEVRRARLLGRHLGQYTLEECLGEGGMGVVYRASHAMLRRPTAVKLLHPAKAGEGSLRRFEREVQLTASLSHPNTVAVFDYGRTPDGILYYAMEYLEGFNLEVLVREDGPQLPGRVVHVLRQICGSLSEAHGIGLIHRDVKPANIILCERGAIPDVAKVVDFGLVKDLERGDGPSRIDIIAGTPLYLAPEAITSGVVDARSDLYALGAVGYFLLTGQTVFAGRNVVEVCSHHLHTAPQPPSERVGRRLPEPLERQILRCLEKAPEARPRSARELAAALAGCPGVDEWSEEDAALWWRRHGARLRRVERGEAAAERLPSSTLTADLSDRVPWRGGGSAPRPDPGRRGLESEHLPGAR
jgi:serine/threonine-protein kinase